MSITERIDRVTSIPQKTAVAPPPISCKIEITQRCNYNCRFCHKSTLAESQTAEMDRALYSRLCRELYDYGCREWAPFFIGESFTCKWLPEAIAEAKEVGYPYIFLTTNGAACTEKSLYQAMAAGLNSLKFSLNFYDEGQFEDVSGAHPRNFRRAIQMLKAARKIRDDHGFSCNIYSSSILFDGEQGKRMRAVIDEVRPFVDDHYFLPLFSMGGASEAAGLRPTQGNPGRAGNMRDPLPCWSVWQAHIRFDGKLTACCFGGGEELDMADLTKTSFADAWNNADFVKLRQAHLERDVTGTACEFCVAG